MGLLSRFVRPKKRCRTAGPSLRVEPLESRVLLSVAAVQPSCLKDIHLEALPVSPEWFASVAQAPPEAQLTSGVGPGRNIVRIDWHGAKIDMRQDEWIVQFRPDSLTSIRSVADTASLLTDAEFDFDVIRGLGRAGQVLVRAPDAQVDAVAAWLSANRHV
ncbi:MAG: hypothetical protein ACOC8D_00360, partial [bacterium]